jgi:hypothetical protein
VARAVTRHVARAPVMTADEFRATIPVNVSPAPAEQRRVADEAAIAHRLTAYNAIADDDTRVPDRIRLLGELDRLIYGWFDQLGTQDFGLDPRAAFMHGVMNQLEAEHVNVTRLTRAAGTLPVDTAGLSPMLQFRATNLWSSISAGAGNLKVTGGGDAGFEDQTYSSLAKMLHTRTGRNLIHALDRPGPGVPPTDVGAMPTRGGVPITGYETFIAPGAGAVGFDALAVAGGDAGSSAQPLSQVYRPEVPLPPHVEPTRMLAEPGDDQDYPVVSDAAQYNQAMFEGRSGYGVATGDELKYARFGAGQGSLVKMDYAQSARSLGPGGTEIITPKFVMLAHELGHAFHNRSGGKASPNNVGYFGQTATDWNQKPEEMSTVQGPENALRAEAGLSQRSVYSTWKHSHGAAGTRALRLQFATIYDELSSAGFTLDDIWAWAQSRPGTRLFFLFGSLEVPDDARDERRAIHNDVTSANGAVSTFKAEFLAMQVPGRLPALLEEISDGKTKAGALWQALTPQERVQALEYLATHRNALEPVKDLLHFDAEARAGSADSARRAHARVTALRVLIAPGGTIAAARAQRDAVAAPALAGV